MAVELFLDKEKDRGDVGRMAEQRTGRGESVMKEGGSGGKFQTKRNTDRKANGSFRSRPGFLYSDRIDLPLLG